MSYCLFSATGPTSIASLGFSILGATMKTVRLTVFALRPHAGLLPHPVFPPVLFKRL